MISLPFAMLSSVVSELDAFGGDFDVMWRGFVTSVIAAVALQYVDPFKTSKLVLFQVCFYFLSLPSTLSHLITHR